MVRGFDPAPFILAHLVFSAVAYYSASMVHDRPEDPGQRDLAREEADAKHREELAKAQVALIEQNTTLTGAVHSSRSEVTVTGLTAVSRGVEGPEGEGGRAQAGDGLSESVTLAVAENALSVCRPSSAGIVGAEKKRRRWGEDVSLRESRPACLTQRVEIARDSKETWHADLASCERRRSVRGARSTAGFGGYHASERRADLLSVIYRVRPSTRHHRRLQWATMYAIADIRRQDQRHRRQRLEVVNIGAEQILISRGTVRRVDLRSCSGNGELMSSQVARLVASPISSDSQSLSGLSRRRIGSHERSLSRTWTIG